MQVEHSELAVFVGGQAEMTDAEHTYYIWRGEIAALEITDKVINIKFLWAGRANSIRWPPDWIEEPDDHTYYDEILLDLCVIRPIWQTQDDGRDKLTELSIVTALGRRYHLYAPGHASNIARSELNTASVKQTGSTSE